MKHKILILLAIVIGASMISSVYAVVYIPVYSPVKKYTDTANHSMPAGLKKQYDRQYHKHPTIPEDTVWKSVEVKNPYTGVVSVYTVPDAGATRHPGLK